MRLTDQEVAEVRAAQGCYRASDVATAYGVARSTISRLWTLQRRTDVPAGQTPDIVTRARPSELAQDIHTLLNRGMTPQEVAQELDVSVSSVYQFKGIFI